MSRIPPTRMNLLRIKRSLRIAESGREILEKKRDILMVELRNFLYDLQRTREELNEALSEAFSYIERAAVHLGVEKVERIAESISKPIEFDVDYRSIMGVTVPKVKLKGEKPEPDYGFLGTNIHLDLAFKKFYALLDLICRLAELEESVYRIAGAIESAQKRINALKHVHIPRYRKLVKEMEMALEEREREDFVRMKKVKSMMEKRRITRGGK